MSPNSFVSQVLCQGLCPPPGDLFPNSFVSQVLCQGLCPPFRDLSPNSFVSQVLCQGMCPPPGDLSPNSFVSQVLCQGLCPPPGDLLQFICLPGPVSGAVSASGGFVSQFICLPIHSSLRSCVKGCVRLRGICFPIHLSPRSSVKGCAGLSGIYLPSFPKQLTVGVLNSILRCVRLVSGAVSASLGSVSPIICLPSFVSHVLCQGLCPPPWALCLPSVPKQFTVGVLNSLSIGVRLCSDGGVWLSGCPEFICPLVAIQLSPNLAGGVQLSGCLQFICLPLSQLICFPVWLVVSRSLAVSNSFVCPYINSFVSQSGWWCPALRLSPIHLSPLVTLHLSPSLAGGVWLSGCLQFICQFVPPRDTSLVSQSGWWCLALWLSPMHLSPACGNSFVSQSGWWCPAFYAVCCLQFICLPLWQYICLPIWLVVSGSGCLQLICFPLWQPICFPVWLVVSGFSAVSNSFVSPYTDSFVSQSGWWCPALAVSNSCVSPCGNPFVSQSGWWCPAFYAVCCLQFICLPLWQLICLPVRLVVSGSLAVSKSFVSPCGYSIVFPQTIFCSGSQFSLKEVSGLVQMLLSGSLIVPHLFVSPCGNRFVSQSGWWCPALRLSPIHLSSLVAIDLSPSLAGGVRLSGCLQVICFPLWQFICF